MLSAKLLLALSIIFVPFVSAQSPLYGQCGGIGWTGATTCVPDAICEVSNPYYSQCLPGSASASPTITTISSSSSGSVSSHSSTKPTTTISSSISSVSHSATISTVTVSSSSISHSSTLSTVTVSTSTILPITTPSSPASPLYGQCGGSGWTGSTTCVAGAVCVVVDSYYSQCLPGSTPSSPSPTVTTTIIISTISSSSSSSSPHTSSSSKPTTTISSSSTSTSPSSSAVPVDGQCGGIGWTGSTTCVAGSTCVVLNPYYSQCLPGSGGPTTTSSSTTSSSSSSTTTTTTTIKSSTSSTTTSSTSTSPTTTPSSPTSPVYGQCGGIGWTGPTTCVAGSVCYYSNPYYSQCLPGSSTTTRSVSALPTTTLAARETGSVNKKREKAPRNNGDNTARKRFGRKKRHDEVGL